MVAVTSSAYKPNQSVFFKSHMHFNLKKDHLLIIQNYLKFFSQVFNTQFFPVQ